MASFGQGINPQLGAINYQPYLQGASQGSAAMGQGIAGLLQGAGQAVQQYYAKQEDKKLNAGFTEYAKEIQKNNPDAWKQAGLPDVSDNGAWKTYIKALGAGNQMKGLSVAAPLLTQFAQQAEVEKSSKRVAAIENMMIAHGGNLPGVIPENLDQTELNKATANVAQYFKQAAEIENIKSEAKARLAPKPGPVPSDKDVLFNELLNQAEAQSPGSSRDPNIRGAIAMKAYGPSAPVTTINNAPAPSPGFQNNYDPQGRLLSQSVIPGSPQAAKITEEGAKDKQSQSLFVQDVSNTLANLRDASDLTLGGAGGPLEGNAVGSMITQMLGRPRNAELRNKYDSIRSALTLNKLQALREASANGASGLGALDKGEWTGLGNSIAALDPTMPEAVQRKAIRQIETYLNKLLITQAKQPAITIEEVK